MKDEAARQSYMLFVICGLFLTCHILRLVLAIHELVSTYLIFALKLSFSFLLCRLQKVGSSSETIFQNILAISKWYIYHFVTFNINPL